MRETNINEFVPHRAPMSLLSEILGFGERWLEAKVIITKDSLFADDRGVPAWIGLEYLAQAIAAYAGTFERTMGAAPKIGLLLGTRRYHCSSSHFFFNDQLHIRIDELIRSESGLSAFACELNGQPQPPNDDAVYASAQLNVFQPEDSHTYFAELRTE